MRAAGPARWPSRSRRTSRRSSVSTSARTISRRRARRRPRTSASRRPTSRAFPSATPSSTSSAATASSTTYVALSSPSRSSRALRGQATRSSSPISSARSIRSSASRWIASSDCATRPISACSPTRTSAGYLDANDLVLLSSEVTREQVDLEERLELARLRRGGAHSHPRASAGQPVRHRGRLVRLPQARPVDP